VQRRRKHQKIGGAPASRGTLGYRKGHLKNFTGNVGDGGRGEGGRREKFSRRTIPKLHVFDHIVLKTWKFPNKKGTFDVNLVFTATLACTKRAIFVTKKGTFHHKKRYFSSQKRAILVL
jgi:hypothetical protein